MWEKNTSIVPWNIYSQIIKSRTKSADRTDLVLAKREKPEWSMEEGEDGAENCNKTLHSNQNFSFPLIEFSPMAKAYLT